MFLLRFPGFRVYPCAVSSSSLLVDPLSWQVPPVCPYADAMSSCTLLVGGISSHHTLQKAAFSDFCVFFWMVKDCIQLQMFSLCFYMDKLGLILCQGLTDDLGLIGCCALGMESLCWQCHLPARSPQWTLLMMLSWSASPHKAVGVESWFCLNTAS